MLAGRGVVVVHQHLEAHRGERRDHLDPQIRHLVERRHGERRPALRPVATVARLVAGARVVRPLLGVDPPEALLRRDREAHVVEHEELGLRRDPRLVGEPGAGEVGLGALGDRARAALVADPGRGLGDVADQDQAGLRAERVEHGGREIRPQQHVGLADVAPAGDRRAVEHHALLEQRRGHRACRHADVLPLAAQIGEAHVDGLHALALQPLEHGLDIRHGVPLVLDRALSLRDLGANARGARRTVRRRRRAAR